MRKAKKQEESLLSLKIELAITILLFVMMMTVIIFAFIMITRDGIIRTPIGQTPTQELVASNICQILRAT